MEFEEVKDLEPAVLRAAEHYSHCCSSVLWFEDLVSIGWIGVLSSVGRHDDSKAKRTTWARIKAEGAILDHLRVLDHLTRDQRQTHKRLDATGSPIPEWMEAPVELDAFENLSSKTPDPNSHRPFEKVDADKTARAICGKASLTPSQRRVVRLMFWSDLNQSEIARRLRRHKGRISRHYLAAIDRLRVAA